MDAKTHHVIRQDAAVTDLDLLFWSLRGITEATGGISTTAWRRQVAITLAGLRPSIDPLTETAVSDETIGHARQAALTG